MGFPGGAAVRRSPADAGDAKRCGFNRMAVFYKDAQQIGLRPLCPVYRRRRR